MVEAPGIIVSMVETAFASDWSWDTQDRNDPRTGQGEKDEMIPETGLNTEVRYTAKQDKERAGRQGEWRDACARARPCIRGLIYAKTSS
jgi:hypothetical protein